MLVKQLIIGNDTWNEDLLKLNFKAHILLLFMSPDFKEKENLLNYLSKKFPESSIVGCSTAGEISDISVLDNSVSLTAIQLEKVTHKKIAVPVKSMEKSYSSGLQLAGKLKRPDLKHVLVFSDGLNVNGADLVSGMIAGLPKVSITGGLAGDGADFNKTFIINDGEITDKMLVAIGLYGDDLKVGYSSKGGWDSFGKDRLVTKAKKNVLFELDGMPALELYKSFLGDKAKDLPGSGLLFPLSLRENETSTRVVRTILSVNEEDQSLTFAGNIPKGSYVRLMKANVDRLINGAQQSAKMANNSLNNDAELAILISCVGRRLVLKQLVEEEVEAVREILGPKPKITGFYSYGEIAPFEEFSPCELHNQTMTITTLSE